jgi:hypothetical protein
VHRARLRGHSHVVEAQLKAPEVISALLFGLVAFIALGALVASYMADVGADVLLAVISAVTPLQ